MAYRPSLPGLLRFYAQWRSGDNGGVCEGSEGSKGEARGWRETSLSPSLPPTSPRREEEEASREADEQGLLVNE